MWAEPQPPKFLGKDFCPLEAPGGSRPLTSGGIFPDLSLCPHTASLLGVCHPMPSPLTPTSYKDTSLTEMGPALLQNGLLSLIAHKEVIS